MQSFLHMLKMTVSDYRTTAAAASTAGESLSLHYYTTGLDSAWPPLIYAGVCDIILQERVYKQFNTPI